MKDKVAIASFTEQTVLGKLPVSVVVCTRNRGDSVLMAVRTVLSNDYPNFELIVVDQSDNNDSENAVLPFLRDSRLRYIRTDSKGKGRALNIGVACASAPLIAMTDDDCEAPTDWLEKMEMVFRKHPKMGMLFCNVLPAPHDPAEGFVPNYVRNDELIIRTLKAKKNAYGIGAGMAARREMIVSLGGFDEMMGPGSRFASADEFDMAMRALVAGYEVIETNRIAVVHYGFRTMLEGKRLIYRDAFGIGAGYAKMLKCHQWEVLPVMQEDLNRLIFRPLGESLVRFRKPPILNRLRGFIGGFLQGLRTSVDYTRILYVDEN